MFHFIIWFHQMVKQMETVKQYSEKEIIKKAIKSLKSILSEVSFVEVTELKAKVKINNRCIDFLLNARISKKPVTFIVEVKSLGEPRLIRMAVEQIKSYLKDFENAYGIVVAPYLSESSKQICMEARIGCIDFAGNAYLSFEKFFIDRSGISNPFTSNRTIKSIFSPKSSRVLRVLLNNPAKKWFVEDMSKEAGISIGLVSKVKKTLLMQEWIKEENKKFYLITPEDILKKWVNGYSYKKNIIFSFYSGLSVDQFETEIKKECLENKWQYGLGLFSGARKLIPFVRFLRFFVYIDGDINKVVNALKLKKVESGANVTLLQPYDQGVFYGFQNIKGINVVSDIQLYLDLKTYKGRGEDAAQAIFEQRIKPSW